MKFEGLSFTMGFFILADENGNIKIGKRDPMTKEIIECYEWENL